MRQAMFRFVLRKFELSRRDIACNYVWTIVWVFMCGMYIAKCVQLKSGALIENLNMVVVKG